jgi:hypothetical protein
MNSQFDLLQIINVRLRAELAEAREAAANWQHAAIDLERELRALQRELESGVLLRHITIDSIIERLEIGDAAEALRTLLGEVRK